MGDDWGPAVRGSAGGRGGRRRPRWGLIAGVAALVVVVVPAMAAAIGLGAVYAAASLPEAFDVEPVVVRDRDGQEIGTIEAQAGRRAVDVAEVPEPVRDAVLASEDARFYEHRGVSPLAVVRAAWSNVLRGEVAQGGSTISQQYVKVVTADTERTFARKIREAVLATKLERRMDKDEILEGYLNNAYFGRGAYGIEAAATAFFGEPAADLTPAEGALLAGLLPAPSHYDPAANPAAAQRRYTSVVRRLDELGWADAADYPHRPPATIDRQPLEVGEAPYFLDAVRQELITHLGGEEAMFAGGHTVTTTLDLGMQRAAEAAEAQVLRELDEPRAAIVALEPGSGEIRALVGGRSYADEPLNLALRAARQPGSTFKPFALAAWLDDGRSPDAVVPAPAMWRRPNCVGSADDCTVRNFGGAGYRALTVREAMWRSVNTVYAQIGQAVGNEAVVAAAEDAGIPAERLDPTVEAVLGAQEVTPLELATAFNTFASGGERYPAHAVTRVERDGQTVYQADHRGERAITSAVASNVTDVLRGVVANGTGRAADIGRPAAGKTGTTSRHADAWFVGYTPHLTAAVWLGRPESNAAMSGNPSGGGLPAQAWARFASAALAGVPAADFSEPEDLATPAPASPGGDASRDVQLEPTPGPAITPGPAPGGPDDDGRDDDEPDGAGDEEPAPEPDPDPDPEPPPETDPEPEPPEERNRGVLPLP